jgi:hypothetical protein
VGLLTSLLFGACARDLRNDSDLSLAPEEFEQKKMVAVDMEKIAAQTAPVAPPQKPAKPVASKVAAAPQKGAVPAAKEKTAVAKTEIPPVKPSVVRAWPIGIGEKSRYSLRWGVIEGGVASMEVKPLQDMDGTPVIHYSAQVHSTKMMDLFYKIDNSIDTWARLSDLAPLRQEIKQNESARFGRRVMLIDPEKNAVKFYEHLTKTKGGVSETKRVDAMADGAQDLFGALYFYRFVQSFDPNFKFPIHDKGKNWFADMKFEEKEEIRVPSGVYKTKRYRVAPRLEGQLKPKGDVFVWISDDDRNLLVKFNAKIKVGSITGELIEHVKGQDIALALPVPKTPVEPADVAVFQNTEE